MKTYFLDYIIILLVVIMLLGGLSPGTVCAAEDYNFGNPGIEDPFEDFEKYNRNPDPDLWGSDNTEREKSAQENSGSLNRDSKAQDKEKENPNLNNKAEDKKNPSLTPENNVEQNTGSKNLKENSDDLSPAKKDNINGNSSPSNKKNEKESPDSNTLNKNKSNPDPEPENKNKENANSNNKDTQKENTGSNSGDKSNVTPASDKQNNRSNEKDKNSKKVNSTPNSNSNSNLNSNPTSDSDLNIENKNNENKKAENSEDKNQIKKIKKNSSSDRVNRNREDTNSNSESKKAENPESGASAKEKVNTGSDKKNQNIVKEKSDSDIENKNEIKSKIPQQEEINLDSRNVNIVKKYANSKIADRDFSGSNNQNSRINSGTTTYFDTENKDGIETINGNPEHTDVPYPGNTENLDSKNIENSDNTNLNNEFSDLMIEDLFFEPENPKPGENTIFTVIVRNNGPSASPKSELVYTISGTNETNNGQIPISSLVMGQISIDTFFWVPQTEGINEVKVEIKTLAEPGSSSSETDEMNNKLIKNIIIGENKASAGQVNLKNKSSGSQLSAESGSESNSESKSSMGSGVSQEPAENIEVKELSTRNVVNGYHMRYDFPEAATCITYIEYDAKRTFKKTTTTVEVLKDQSNLVSNPPAGKIYEYVNIWVGDKGAGLPEALDNGVVGFKVEKAWIDKNSNNVNKSEDENKNENTELKGNENKNDKNNTDNNNANSINEPEIILQWYDKEWKPLETEKKGEDKKYIFFEAKTPGYSSFAITNTQQSNKEENKIQEDVKLQNTTKNKENVTLKGVTNESLEKQAVKTNQVSSISKVLIAFSLTVFMVIAEILIFRKKL